MEERSVTDQTPVVKVTLESMYRLLLEIREDVNSMKPNRSALDDHEQRIRKVEQMIWKAAGAAAAIGGTVGVLGAKLF